MLVYTRIVLGIDDFILSLSLQSIKNNFMATPIRSIPVLEGEVARRFLREIKENEKRRGTYKISQEAIEGFKKMEAEYRKRIAGELQ